MEIHLGFRAYRMRPLFKLIKFDKPTSLFIPIKIWCYEPHQVLVSCQNFDFSGNGSHLKESVQEVEFLRWAKLVNFQDFQLFEKMLDFEWL